MDFNSNSFRIFYNGSGLTLRIEFETDGNEIKGWKRKAKIRGRRDKGAADANIKAQTGSDFPFIEIDLENFIVEGDNIRIGEPSEDDSCVDY